LNSLTAMAAWSNACISGAPRRRVCSPRASPPTVSRTVLEGEFGFLKVYCTKWDEAELTRGLGEEFLVSTTVLKRYPCHATAHAAVKAVRDLQATHGFRGAEVETITVTGTMRMIERHNIPEPADLMLAQYSIPFCVALALHREARDPESWDETALGDPHVGAGSKCHPSAN
jgi:2-methylcitrate dehydratase PrpD